MANEIRDAQVAIVRAIAELKAANVEIPQSLYLAAHALTYALRLNPEPIMPTCNGQGHAGAL
jgi:hypothetical protein